MDNFQQQSDFSNFPHPPQAPTEVVSVKEWMITTLIMVIPIVNLVMLFVWAFGNGQIAKSKENWAKATLIWMVIVVILYVIFFAVFGAYLMRAAGVNDFDSI